jgi:hypothetical protein
MPGAVETGGLKELDRQFAIYRKIHLNRFGVCKIAAIPAFWICSVLVRFAPVQGTTCSR